MPEIVPLRLGRSTAFLVKGARPILVDCGTPGNEERIIERLREEIGQYFEDVETTDQAEDQRYGVQVV